MDHFTVSNPTCRSDLSTFTAHRDVDPHDHFRVDTGTDRHVLSDPDERLVVGVDALALWHAEVDDEADAPSSPEARAEVCTRVAFEDIEHVEWHGDTIARREDSSEQSYNQMATPMGDAFRKLDRDEVSALKEVLKQDD